MNTQFDWDILTSIAPSKSLEKIVGRLSSNKPAATLNLKNKSIYFNALAKQQLGSVWLKITNGSKKPQPFLVFEPTSPNAEDALQLRLNGNSKHGYGLMLNLTYVKYLYQNLCNYFSNDLNKRFYFDIKRYARDGRTLWVIDLEHPFKTSNQRKSPEKKDN